MSKNLTNEEKALLAEQEHTDRTAGARRGRKPAAAKVNAPAEASPREESAPEVAFVSREMETAAPKEDTPAQAAATPSARGPLTPAQYGGDGWDDTPVQMRG